MMSPRSGSDSHNAHPSILGGVAEEGGDGVNCRSFADKIGQWLR